MRVRGWLRKKPTIRARHSEAGFTLAELIVCIAILGIIGGALGAAFVVTAHDSIGISKRYKESHDAQIASAYLATDVQSSAALTSSTCGSLGGTPLINFQYGTDVGSPIATYSYRTGAKGTDGPESQLVRSFCGSPSADSILAHYAGSAPPAVTCDGAACNVGSAPRPNVVKIKVTAPDGYAYSLSGARRSYATAATPPNPAPYGVLALGSGALILSGKSTMNVAGPLIVNSQIPGGAVNLSGPLARLNSTLFQIVTPGSCTGCVGRATPLPTPRADVVPDPFLGLAYPDESSLALHSGSTYEGPGVYTQTLKISSPTTLADGTYVLEGGIDISKTDVTAAHVLIFIGCGRNFTVGCSPVAARFNMSGASSLNAAPMNSGPFAGLLIWQAREDTNPISITGSSKASLLDGIIYAPTTSNLAIGSQASTITVRSIVGTNISMTSPPSSTGAVVNVG
jgi:prepilin-type N-terminal cleavage/methylation domain-containing protein